MSRLIDRTVFEAMRHIVHQSSLYNRSKLEVLKFEELCALLRQQGSNFKEVLDTDEDEVIYHLYPTNHGDYLEIIEALGAMGAHRIQSAPNCEIVNPQPDAPTFWLHIPDTN